MSDVRDAATDQPLPEPGREPIHQMLIDTLGLWIPKQDARQLIADELASRRDLGIRKYGRPLESFNGRDALQDAWQELLDASVYVLQMEREGRRVGDIFMTMMSLLSRVADMKLREQRGE